MNTTDLTKTFEAPTGQPIRSVLIDGDPWFVAHDVCLALGLSVYGGTSQHLGGLSSDEKRKATRRDLPGLFPRTSAGSLSIVSEPGLYALISRSHKPEARAFDRWVRHEVLPSIRKTGSYALADHGRTEMPLQAEFLDALRESTAAQLAVAQAVAAAMERMEAIFAASNPPKQDERLRTAKQLLAMGVVRGMSTSALGKKLTVVA